jgi:hypothetical protein
MRLRIALLAALSLLIGFAIAQITGNRAAGGVVLLVGGLWCAWQLLRVAGVWRTVIVGVVYVAAFALSHPLGKAIGPWPSVVIVALATGAVAYWLTPVSGTPAIRRKST